MTYYKHVIGSVLMLLVGACASTSALDESEKADYYVAVNGNDQNPGSITKPFATLMEAQSVAKAGDLIYIRGGEYRFQEKDIVKVHRKVFACLIFLDKSGAPGKRIRYEAYPGETPVFNFSRVKPKGKRVVGIWLAADHIHLKGFEITGIQVTIKKHTESYCIYSWGNHNILELLTLHDNVGTGLRHRSGDHNLFLNCDAYRNHDNVSERGKGGNTDGFGCHPAEGANNNVFRGCRAWFNSDDGYDLILAGGKVTFENCYAFYNGYSPEFKRLANGAGFKAGGYGYEPEHKLPKVIPTHIIKSCISVRNGAHGFYANHHAGGNVWIGNRAYGNFTNFNMVNRKDSKNINIEGYGHILKENVSYQSQRGEVVKINRKACELENNLFDGVDGVRFKESDFESLDETLLVAPRLPNGDLPDIPFMKLKNPEGFLKRPAEGEASKE